MAMKSYQDIKNYFQFLAEDHVSIRQSDGDLRWFRSKEEANHYISNLGKGQTTGLWVVFVDNLAGQVNGHLRNVHDFWSLRLTIVKCAKAADFNDIEAVKNETFLVLHDFLSQIKEDHRNYCLTTNDKIAGFDHEATSHREVKLWDNYHGHEFSLRINARLELIHNTTKWLSQ